MRREIRLISASFFIACLPLLFISADTLPERRYLPYTPELYQQIDQINRTWNDKIKYVSDIEHYGMPEKWTVSKDDKGDCDDYAITKQSELKKYGVPSYLVLCRTPKGEIHLVLQVFTEHGALVLSNPVKGTQGAENLHYAQDFIRVGFEWIKIQFSDGWYSYRTGGKVKPPRGWVEFIKDKE